MIHEDEFGEALMEACHVGERGHFVKLNGVTPDGRPYLICLGVGDGCEVLDQLVRKAPTIRTIRDEGKPDGQD